MTQRARIVTALPLPNAADSKDDPLLVLKLPGESSKHYLRVCSPISGDWDWDLIWEGPPAP